MCLFAVHLHLFFSCQSLLKSSLCQSLVVSHTLLSLLLPMTLGSDSYACVLKQDRSISWLNVNPGLVLCGLSWFSYCVVCWYVTQASSGTDNLDKFFVTRENYCNTMLDTVCQGHGVILPAQNCFVYSVILILLWRCNTTRSNFENEGNV